VGLLDSLLQLTEDCELYFVPVGINYDRVLEDEALLAELRGRAHPPTAAEKLRGALRLLWIVPWRAAVNAVRVAAGRLQRHGYVAVAFGEPVRFRDLPNPRASRDSRRAAAGAGEGDRGAPDERIARVIPATPVTLVARAALDLSCDASTGDLVQRVRELRTRLEESGVPTAMGREFDPQRQARAELRDDLARTRDLARLEIDLLAARRRRRSCAWG